MSFNVGEVVKLKSGGPKMTIERIDSDGSALCAWFDNKSERQKAMFALATLEPVTGMSANALEAARSKSSAWS